MKQLILRVDNCSDSTQGNQLMTNKLK
ncbi:MAG: hypothetical protein ACI9SQ_002140, partial [Rubritalea sp.]